MKTDNTSKAYSFNKNYWPMNTDLNYKYMNYSAASDRVSKQF